MKRMLTAVLLTVLAPAGMVTAQADKAFEDKTWHYTGGEYQGEVFHYRLMRPAKLEKGKKYPLVLFLHGAGERGTDNRNQLKYLPEQLARAENREKYPCFVLAPQCRPGKQWVRVNWADKKSTKMPAQPSDQMKVAVAALLRTVQDEAVDASRVYVTGLSMGGYGTWDLASRHPEWFAAIAPLCGGGDERQAKKLVGKPLWAFHGDKDGAVPVERSRQMIEAIKSAGGEPKYTEYKGAGHGIWGQAYGDPRGVIPWMFARTNPKASFPPPPAQAPEKRK